MSYVVRRRFGFGGGISPAAAWILGLQVGFFLLYIFLSEGARNAMLAWLALNPADLARLHLWKLATTAVINTNAWAFFFDALMLWLFVPSLERWWGTKRFLAFFAWTELVGNLAGALCGLALGRMGLIDGIQPFILASLIAYGVLHADRPLQFFGVVPIKAKVLAIGVAAFTLLFVLLERDWVSGARSFSAMGLAWLMTSGVFTPNLWWLQFRRWRLSRRYKVLDGGKSKKPDEKRWMN